MKSGIYKITSPTGKIYVGQSVNVKSRFRMYQLMHCKKQVVLYRSFVKYGVINHKFEVIEECSIDVLNERERHYQDLYECIGKNGLNCKLTTTKDKSGKYSQHTIEKMRKSMTGKGKGLKRSAESILKGTLKNKGRKRTEEFRIKLKNSRIGKGNPMFGKKIKESSKQLQRDKLSGENNYLSKWLLNIEAGIFYPCLNEAGYSIDMDKRVLWQNIKKNKNNKTSFVYA